MTAHSKIDARSAYTIDAAMDVILPRRGVAAPTMGRRHFRTPHRIATPPESSFTSAVR
ncbi:hypothetical protein [Tropicimonas sp. IMCC6043]|uniref:hypothetical protein n=1 Tax=Tropicimonas sp. IMCC6043 TaxID=2510645 RepID=UPI0013ED6F02|nr:hypothetical protein [Tropicimonas sp. IMCC6043]